MASLTSIRFLIVVRLSRSEVEEMKEEELELCRLTSCMSGSEWNFILGLHPAGRTRGSLRLSPVPKLLLHCRFVHFI